MLDDFTTGNRDLVERLNELIEVARQVKNMTGDDTIKVRHTASGINISMDRQRCGGSSVGVRNAFVKTTPAAVETVVCWLSDTDGSGDEITVNCSVIGGTALNAAVPRLADGERIAVFYDGSNWRCCTTFQASEDCT